MSDPGELVVGLPFAGTEDGRELPVVQARCYRLIRQLWAALSKNMEHMAAPAQGTITIEDGYDTYILCNYMQNMQTGDIKLAPVRRIDMPVLSKETLVDHKGDGHGMD